MIPGGTLLAAEIPIAKIKPVQSLNEIHKEGLLVDCELAVTGQPPLPIDAPVIGAYTIETITRVVLRNDFYLEVWFNSG